MSSWSKGLEWSCPGSAPEPQLLVEKQRSNETSQKSTSIMKMDFVIWAKKKQNNIDSV